MGSFVEHCLRRKDLPVLAEAALRNLLIDPCLLERVQAAVRGQAFEGGDFASYGRRGQDAGANRGAVDEDGAGAALAKFGPAQPRRRQRARRPHDRDRPVRP